MEGAYVAIVNSGGTYPDYTLRIFQALTDTSVKNTDFRNSMQREYDDWEVGRTAITADALSLIARTRYNNMIETTVGSGNKWTAADPQETKIMALTTKLEQLKSGTRPTTGGYPRQQQSQQQQRSNGIPDWQKTFKGNKITQDGVEYEWCSRHGDDRPGGFKGLYMRSPHDHEQWKEAKAARRSKFDRRKGGNGGGGNSNGGGAGNANRNASNSTSGKSLQLKQGLKSILMTQHGVSSADADKIWAEVNQEN